MNDDKLEIKMSNGDYLTLLILSSLSAMSMLCCAIVSFSDLLNLVTHHQHGEPGPACSLLRSGWFFYGNAALCLSSLFAMFWAS